MQKIIKMKHFKNILIGLGVLALVYFIFQKPEPEIIRTKVPVKFDVTVPEQKIVFEPVKLPTPKRERSRPIEEFIEADSTEKDSLYRDAVTIRDYTEVYEDSAATTTVDSKVQGRLLEQHVRTDIHKKVIPVDTVVEAEVKIPKRIKVLVGADVKGNVYDITDLSPVIYPGVMIQNKKDNVIKLNFGTDKSVLIGYYIKL